MFNAESNVKEREQTALRRATTDKLQPHLTSIALQEDHPFWKPFVLHAIPSSEEWPELVIEETSLQRTIEFGKMSRHTTERRRRLPQRLDHSLRPSLQCLSYRIQRKMNEMALFSLYQYGNMIERSLAPRPIKASQRLHVLQSHAAAIPHAPILRAETGVAENRLHPQVRAYAEEGLRELWRDMLVWWVPIPDVAVNEEGEDDIGSAVFDFAV